jgi:hypothetical protein
MNEGAGSPHAGHYLKLLERVHEHVRPRTYVEIGMHVGASFTLVQPETLAIGVDPLPGLRKPINTTAKVFFETSDDFFAHRDVIGELGGSRIDMAFIDGMHWFEYALRDFRNIERACGRDSVVFVHDCVPADEAQTARERSTQLWAGDVWKLVVALERYRPDLKITTIAVGPTGLGMITGLDPENSVLFDAYDEIVEQCSALRFADVDPVATFGAIPNEWSRIEPILPGPFVAPGAAPAASKRRRWTARIAWHQAKRSISLLRQRATPSMLRR